MGRFCSVYEPVSSVTALRLPPVAVCVAVTSTPGNTAPDWSFTVPATWAVPCAQIIVVANDKKATATTAHANTLIDFRIIDFSPRRRTRFISFLLWFGEQR